MKKTIYYLALISIILLSTASSCTDDEPTEPQLPTGENTMYYYVDGKLYIPKSSGGFLEPYTPAIRFSNCNDDSYNIGTLNLFFHFYNGITQIEEITLNQSHYDSCQVFDNHGNYGKKESNKNGVMITKYYYTHNGSGTVNITYLSENKRHFKGTFDMTVYHEDTNEEIHITNGHFNINLDTLND